jgi:hypothetical protein
MTIVVVLIFLILIVVVVDIIVDETNVFASVDVDEVFKTCADTKEFALFII